MPLDCWASGRVLVTRHMAFSHILQVGAIYGFPKGPTYPQAHALTSRLLAPLTQELVLGSCGPRLIMGDFNATPGDRSHLDAFDMDSLGWRSVQDYAAQVLQWTPQPTCKGATNRDMIWASPEALAMIQDIRLQDHFADHSTLSIGLRIQRRVPRLLHWPKPRPIPWALVKDSWDPAPPSAPSPPANTTTRYAHLWSSIEASLSGQLQRREYASLTSHELGRGQRTTPNPIPDGFHAPSPPWGSGPSKRPCRDCRPAMVPPAAPHTELQPRRQGRLHGGHGYSSPSRALGRHQ